MSVFDNTWFPPSEMEVYGGCIIDEMFSYNISQDILQEINYTGRAFEKRYKWDIKMFTSCNPKPIKFNIGLL